MDNYWNKLAYAKQSINECGSEKISFLGAVQDCSCLVVFQPRSGKIVAHSENFGEKVSPSQSNPLEQSLFELVPPPKKFDSWESALSSGAKSHLVDFEGKSFSTSLYTVGNLAYLEFEFCEVKDDFDFDLTKEFLEFEANYTTQGLEKFLKRTTDTLKKVSMFDRVMIYRFEPNKDGHVVCESKNQDLEPFLGLRYPATDIPPQARKLFFESSSRSIEDVHSMPSALLTAQGYAQADIDLSQTYFRAVSPFHIEYLKNMGVSATFSIPIKVEGDLWGIIAFHNYQGPLCLTLKERTACEIMGRFVSNWISSYVNHRRVLNKNKILELSQEILDAISSGHSPVESFTQNGDSLLDTLEATGFSVKIGENYTHYGSYPSRNKVKGIAEQLKHHQGLSIWKTEDAPLEGLPSDPKAVGVLAIPLSVGFEDFIFWYRPAAVQTVTWAGKPKHKDNAQKRLSPRGSFSLWEETIKNRSLEWSRDNTECAQYILFSFVRDIFRKASELSAANKELQRVTQAKDEFIGLVSHELRTPLNVMLGWIDILNDSPSLPEDIQGAVDTIDRNARVQVNLINDLLDISRIISGKMRVNFQKDIRLKALVEEVVEDLSPTAHTKNISIGCDLDDQCITSGDPERLRQVVWNLLSNAIKFTPKDGKVDLSVVRHASSYQIIVADDGIGIEPSKVPFVFDRFNQASTSQYSSSGLGLGLSIVKAIVELHGGEISAQSFGLNQGSTFTVTLPIYAVPLEEEAEAQKKNIDPTVNFRLDEKKILVVEDQQDAALALKIILERLGAVVSVEPDGKSGFAQFATAEHGEFDYILSDIGMPNWDGYRMIKEIRHLEKERGVTKVPAIALTAYATAKDKNKCLEAGFNIHLPKPVDKAELIKTIQALIAAE